MKHFLLFYETSPDYLEKRPLYRKAHLEKVWASHDRGELVLGGALTEPTDTAVLFFKAADKAAVEDFARTDPYVTNGLITSWRVREWMTVAGADSVNPVRPDTL
ncbi:MAG: YciI-like protein [Rhodospirillaceae bacterium]